MSSLVGPVVSVPQTNQLPASEPVVGKFAQRLIELQQAQAPTPPIPPEISAVGLWVKDIESGQATLGRWLNAAENGESFSNAEVLALQVAMYRYATEVELLGKVIQAAVSALRDVLRTQV